MELNSRIKKVPITDADTNETTYHHIERLDGKELTRYRRALSKNASINRGGSKVDVNEVKPKLEAWGRQIREVKGYTVDGKNLMETDKWRTAMMHLAPDHCLVAFEAISSVFADEQEKTDDDSDEETEAGSEVDFLPESSKDASDDG